MSEEQPCRWNLCLGMGTALCYCCGCLSSSVDITLAPTRYCPNINLYFQDLGCKQTQQFGCPSGTGHVLWLLCQEQHKVQVRKPQLECINSLPSRDVILKCVANKIHINHLIYKLTLNDQEFLNEATSHYRLFISGEEAVPTVVYRGWHRAELQLYTTHEEADIRIVKHALWSCERHTCCVIPDDTDVFALFCYHYQKRGSSAEVMIGPSVNERVYVDISATVKKH